MNINIEKLYTFLQSKGINYLYHANTVQTSCTFIHCKGLMSRGAVEKNNVIQTYQQSDLIDKKFDVWSDIFLDVVDMHGYFPRQNIYGSVVFKFKLEILKRADLPKLWITKDNPIYWHDGQSYLERYYEDVDEYTSEFDFNINNKTIQSKMITLREMNSPLLFDENLDSIILDNPNVLLGGTNLYNEAIFALKSAMQISNMPSSILKTRECNNCYCHGNYLNRIKSDDLKRLFLLAG